MMGTYRLSTKEIINLLIDALEDSGGDFDNTQLSKALTFMQGYAPTLDSNTAREKEWELNMHKLDQMIDYE